MNHLGEWIWGGSGWKPLGWRLEEGIWEEGNLEKAVGGAFGWKLKLSGELLS